MGWRYWALGQAANGIAGTIGDDAMRLADRFVGCRPCDPLAVAMMASGADALLERDPTSLEALTVLRRSALLLHRPRPEANWCWPEQELDPFDALLPHALMAAGDRLDEGALIRSGLQLLDWRLDRNGESCEPAQEFALSVIACARAVRLTGDGRWTARARALAPAVSVEVSLRTSDLCAWQLAARHLDALRASGLADTLADTGAISSSARSGRSTAKPQLATHG